jgi:thiamine biosynthesis lipoprotein
MDNRPTGPRSTPLLAVVLAAASHVAAAEPQAGRHTFDRALMGTRFRIVLYAGERESARAAAEAAFARIAQLDAVTSDYKADSELLTLCAKAAGGPVRVSEDLFEVLKLSLDLAGRSDGAFDVTVGPMVQLWRRSRRTQRLPTDEALAEARRVVGSAKVRLDSAGRTVHLTVAGMQLDLGGIAKGYAADAALAVLRKLGFTRAMVAAGGDIVVGDAPPGQAGWRIGIAPLDDQARPPSRFLTLSNAAVSTSGDAEQYTEIAGVRYSHIVDPRTGLGLIGRNSVTVVAAGGVAADSLATAACVLGPQRGLKLIDQTAGAAALFVRRTDKGEETFTSRRWDALKATTE